MATYELSDKQRNLLGALLGHALDQHHDWYQQGDDFLAATFESNVTEVVGVMETLGVVTDDDAAAYVEHHPPR